MTNGGTMASEQSDQLAELYGVSRDRLSNPNLDLQTIRDMCDALGAAGREPEGVSYAEVDAGGVPALWCIPAGCDDQAAGHRAKAAAIRALGLDYPRSPQTQVPDQPHH